MLLQDKKSTKLDHLLQLILSVGIGFLTVIALLVIFATQVQDTKAAPPPRPFQVIITDPVSVTHTNNTTHTMSVFADGRLTNRFFAADGSPSGRNQIDQTFDDPSGTTLAVLFDQHPLTHTVDVGVQGDFTALTPITLNTSSTIPGYSEDTQVIYASQVLPYQITQRTLATSTLNCVIMELVVRNTGSTPLTGGRLLYMMDVDAAHTETGDIGGYDPAKQLVYITDFNDTGSTTLPGFGVGVALLQGELAGYRVNGDVNVYAPDSYPTSDADIKTQMVTPPNIITDGANDALWLVASIPDLAQNQEKMLVFSICAKNALTEEEVTDDLIDEQENVVSLSATKTATPAAGTAGQPFTYTISLLNNGAFYIDGVVLTDTLPASVTLVDYSVSQGSITADNGLITATIGRIYPSSQPVVVTLAVVPSPSLPDGTIITNQAFISSTLLYTPTNVASYLIAPPLLTVIKESAPEPVKAGGTLDYTIKIKNEGQADAVGVVVSDTVPFNTTFIPGSVTVTPTVAGVVIGPPPLLVQNLTVQANSEVTVTYQVQVGIPLPNGTIITNTVTLSSPQIISPVDDIVTNTVTSTPTLQIVKAGPAFANIGQTAVFAFTVTNIGTTLLQNILVEDSLAGPVFFVGGDNGDGLLDLTETWLYTAAYTIPPTATSPLVNIGTVTGSDLLGTQVVATDSHTTLIEFNPTLQLTKQGPITAAINNPITYTFTVRHTDFSDGAPLGSLILTDTIAGPAAYQSGDDGDGLLEAGEIWIFTVSYTPLFTDTSPLINVGTIQGIDPDGDVITATASHLTLLKKYNPVLSLVKGGPAVANVGATVVFTFMVSHAPDTDHTPVSNLFVIDSVAGLAAYQTGDDGDNLLEDGESWLYSVNYVIKPTDPNPLLNTGAVLGRDEENDVVSASGSHTTTLVGFAPVLFVDKDGPAQAVVGSTIVYTITVINYASDSLTALAQFDLDPIAVANIQPGDGSPISITTIIDEIAGPPVYVGGDIGGKIGLLDAGEGWVYTVSYTVQPADASPLINRVTVNGLDQEGDWLDARATHTTTLISSPDFHHKFFLPVIFKKP